MARTLAAARSKCTKPTSVLEAARNYASEVAVGTFPADEQTVRMDDDTLDEVLGRGSMDRAEGTIPLGGIPLDRDL